MGDFSWATETNYPAGVNPWNGQPLSVAPAGDYLLPNTKLPAETVNYVLQNIGLNLPQTVASVAALRALPVPTSTKPIYLSPENNGSAINGLGAFPNFNLGGLYLYDSAWAALDDGATNIQPTAITGTNPGRWRLTGKGPALIQDQWEDTSTAGGSINFSATLGSVSTANLSNGGTPFAINLAVSALNPQGMYLGDVIDADAIVTMTAGNSTQASCYFVHSGTPASAVANLNNSGTSGQIQAAVSIRLRHTVVSTDITAGSYNLGIQLSQNSTGSSSAFLSSVRYTVRRPS